VRLKEEVSKNISKLSRKLSRHTCDTVICA
jgi:hypothetical protein